MLNLIVVLVTSLAVGVSAQGGGTKNDTCYRYDVDGCSIPFQLPFFFKELFTHSCARHDICYHCGVSYHIDRAACDVALRNDTTTACKRRYLSPGPSYLASTDFKLRLIQVVDDHEDDLRSLIREQLGAFKSSQPNPDVFEYFRFFRTLRTSKVLVKWIELMKDDLSNIPKRDEELTSAWGSVGDDIKDVEDAVEDSLCYVIYAGTSLLGVSLDCQSIGYMVCHFFSEVYYMGVNVFGGPSYHDTPEFYCNEEFVPKCLPGSPL